jgi:two-component system chemotaxis sensor kinase CheA
MGELEQFKATYFAECAELLSDSEETLARLEQGARDPDLLNAVFRAVHSIKGGAGAFGFDDLVGFAHAFETLLDLLREGKVEPTPETVALCIRGLDVVADLVAAARDGAPAPRDFGVDVKARIEDLSGGAGCVVIEDFDDIDFTPVRARPDDDVAVAPAEPGAARWQIAFKPHRALYERANDPLLLLRELRSLGRVEVTAEIGEVPPLAEFDPNRPLIAWGIVLETAARRDEIESVFEFVEGDCDLVIAEAADAPAPASAESDAGDGPSLLRLLAELAPGAAAPASPSLAQLARAFAPEPPPPEPARAAPPPAGRPEPQASSIRVDLDKVDRVVDMVGELVITQASLTQQIDDHLRERYPEVVRGLEVLAQHTRALQDSVMSIRAQPVKSVFARMPRLVRELARELGKKARLEMAGEATEIDKTVIEQLADPLTHMIRNSLDHGIETPERRLAAGKPEEGVIRLSASQAGGRIVIEVRDDGAGIDRARVLAKAVERGLVTEEAALADEDIDALIFAPGFSTAEAVTSVSGRGVGMDVVRRNIQRLGGRVSVRNAPGRGAALTLTLPLTLAVLDVMLVRVGATPFVVPLASIIGSMQVDGAAIGRLPSGARVLRARGDYVQVVELADLFGIAPAGSGEGPGFVVLCESDGAQRTAIAVDWILGQQQVVIKSLEANFERLDGVAGATILGDGSVALILDIAGLKRLADRRLVAPGARAAA